jgi:thiol-disulfide isomerase/thioredoxin/ferredoxin
MGALQNAFSSSNKTAPYYMLGIIMLYGVIFGRWICGWLCPFGLLQDLLHKIKTPKLKKNIFTKILSAAKYVILAIFGVIIPLIYMTKDFPLPAFCKYICPAGTVGGALGLLINPSNSEFFDMLGTLFTWKFVLAVSIVVSCVFIYRTFCRFLCPLGALYGFFNKFSLFGIKLEKDKCVNCGKCISVCKMDIHHVGDMECINCGECISVCPTKAISYKGAKIILPDSEIEAAKTEEEKCLIEEKRNERIKIFRIITSIILVITLCFSLVYCNFIYDDGNNGGGIVDDEQEDDTPIGYRVGEKCPSFYLDLVDGSGKVNVKDYRGKIVIINFWGTWCGPCKSELPDFDRIATDYADEVVVLTIHTVRDKDSAPDYIKQHFADSKMIFAYDAPLDLEREIDVYYDALGGKNNTYPRTLILNDKGVVMYTVFGAPADVYEEGKDAIYNKLASLIEQIKNLEE